MKIPLVFVFPGQGSQSAGMGKELYDNFPEARTLFEKAAQVLGERLLKVCFEGPEEELKKTSIAQPAIFTVSAAACEVLKNKKILPGVVAGHSLGEYTALYAAGVASFEELLKMVAGRGRLMEEASPKDGAMVAIIGLGVEKIQQLLTSLGEGVEIGRASCRERV